MVGAEGFGPEDLLIGQSQAIHQICDQLRKAAFTELPVLITGESGTGKDLAARLLHMFSARAGVFLKLSCPNIMDCSFHNDLFGYEKESPFQASSYVSEEFEGKRNCGTLFLDKIDELDTALQPKLLYALQSSQGEKLSAGDKNLRGMRLICAAGNNFEFNVSRGLFRNDLFYRINVVNIHIPPLRERLADIPILMDHFIRTYVDRFGGKLAPLSPSCLQILMSYDWPGNVRELENIAKRFVVLGGEEHIISAIQQPHKIHQGLLETTDLTTPLRIQTRRALRHLEKKIILGVLEAHKWNRRKTARSLDISYRALLYKIREIELPVESYPNISESEISLNILAEKLPNKYRN